MDPVLDEMFFFSSRRRHTRSLCDWSSDVCSSDLTDATTGVTTVTLGGSNGVKVYRVKDADATNVIFGVSANYTYNTALAPATSPFGDKGFVVMRKGGDALSLRKNNATAASYGGDASKFH